MTHHTGERDAKPHCIEVDYFLDDLEATTCSGEGHLSRWFCRSGKQVQGPDQIT